MTPEGYLLCEDVPIGRTGSQLYADSELPFLEAARDCTIAIQREEADVFSPETIASFEGKSVTVGHVFVDPDNWGRDTKGVVRNVRRGADGQSDLLLADLLITDAAAIEDVRAGLREVSCGYEADYEQDGPGRAYQRNIIGNHVALVPRGRAGHRCAIQDEETMKPKQSAPLLRRLLSAARTGDMALIKRTADAAEDEVEAEEKKAADEEMAEREQKTADSIADLKKTVDTLVAALAGKTKDDATLGVELDEAAKADQGTQNTGDEEPDEEEKKKTADAMRDVLVRAEILSPGFRMPTGDSVKGLKGVIALQRKILSGAKDAAAPLLAGRTADSLSDAEVSTLFIAASEIQKAKNNAGTSRTSDGAGAQQKSTPTPAEMNARNKLFWNPR